MSPSGWEFDHVGRAVRAAREADGVSQRELARRAGISPSVISRIEAGIVRQPDERTSDRIAAALGRSGRALYYLSGYEHWTWACDELVPHLPWAREALGEFQHASRDEWDSLERKWQEPMLDAVLTYFLESTVTNRLRDHGLEDELMDALERIGSRLPGLTDRRRALVLEFIDDQLALSELDRLAVERAERAGANSDRSERAGA
jgi:transcriptional regulator with XRE-family HTH domain